MIQIYVVPGFFGFTQLGTLNYFQGVSSCLHQALEAKGFKAKIIEVKTQPTSSIRRRAIRLLETVVAQGGLTKEAIFHYTSGFR